MRPRGAARDCCYPFRQNVSQIGFSFAAVRTFSGFRLRGALYRTLRTFRAQWSGGIEPRRGRTEQGVYKLRLLFDLTRRSECSALPPGSHLESRASSDCVLSAPARWLSPLSESRAQPERRVLRINLEQRVRGNRRTCVFSRWIKEPTGDLRLQLCRIIDHVETGRPRMCVAHILAVNIETRICATPADTARSLELYNDVYVRRRGERRAGGLLGDAAVASIDLLVALDGVDVGTASAVLTTSHPDVAFLVLGVLPEHRGTGPGRRSTPACRAGRPSTASTRWKRAPRATTTRASPSPRVAVSSRRGTSAASRSL